jgi:hypothetical protein
LLLFLDLFLPDLFFREDTLLSHPRLLALSEPAQLALAPHEGIHLAGAAPPAGVAPSPTMDHTAPEEALAAFATEDIVVETRGLVPTHTAKLVTQHLWSWALLSLALRLLLLL